MTIGGPAVNKNPGKREKKKKMNPCIDKIGQEETHSCEHREIFTAKKPETNTKKTNTKEMKKRG